MEFTQEEEQTINDVYIQKQQEKCLSILYKMKADTEQMIQEFINFIKSIDIGIFMQYIFEHNLVKIFICLKETKKIQIELKPDFKDQIKILASRQQLTKNETIKQDKIQYMVERFFEEKLEEFIKIQRRNQEEDIPINKKLAFILKNQQEQIDIDDQILRKLQLDYQYLIKQIFKYAFNEKTQDIEVTQGECKSSFISLSQLYIDVRQLEQELFKIFDSLQFSKLNKINSDLITKFIQTEIQYQQHIDLNSHFQFMIFRINDQVVIIDNKISILDIYVINYTQLEFDNEYQELSTTNRFIKKYTYLIIPFQILQKFSDKLLILVVTQFGNKQLKQYQMITMEELEQLNKQLKNDQNNNRQRDNYMEESKRDDHQLYKQVWNQQPENKWAQKSNYTFTQLYVKVFKKQFQKSHNIDQPIDAFYNQIELWNLREQAKLKKWPVINDLKYENFQHNQQIDYSRYDYTILYENYKIVQVILIRNKYLISENELIISYFHNIDNFKQSSQAIDLFTLKSYIYFIEAFIEKILSQNLKKKEMITIEEVCDGKRIHLLQGILNKDIDLLYQLFDSIGFT